MPTLEEAYQQLVARGMMPLDAEEIVLRVAARNGDILDEPNAEMLAMFTLEQVTSDRMWVLVTPDIPNEFRRMWLARIIANE